MTVVVQHDIVAIAKADIGNSNVKIYASVEIKDESNISYVTVYQNAAASSTYTQPGMQTNSLGYLRVYLPPGVYSVTIDSGTSYQIQIKSERIAPRSFSSSTSLLLTDLNKMLEFTGSSAANLTVDPVGTTDYGEGFIVHGCNLGTANLTVVEGSGVTVEPPAGGTLVVPPNGIFTLYYSGTVTNKWILGGGTEAA